MLTSNMAGAILRRYWIYTSSIATCRHPSIPSSEPKELTMPGSLKFSCPFANFVIILLASLAAWATPAYAADLPSAKAQNQDLERARREVKLLDDIYKTAIVLITTHYVNDDKDMPAGEAFKALFQGMKEKGWHEVRLLDAAGEPLNEDNNPKDAFEKNAIKALLGGKPYYEEVAQQDGKPYLRAATPLPIVMNKCKMCHANYRDQKVIGAIGYALPLQADGPTR
jgi:hypothetical protein